MGFLGLEIQFRNLAILVIILASSSSLAAIFPPIAKSHCTDHCGNVTIPFPFGTSPDCYLSPQFFINCSISSNGTKAFLMRSNLEITNISLGGQLTVLNRVAYSCYGQNQPNNNNNNYSQIMSGAMDDLEDGACMGSGCCQVSIPKNIRRVSMKLRSFNNYTNVSEFNDCGFAFVAENATFTFSPDNLTNMVGKRLPMVIDWDIGKGTNCDQAKMDSSTYACNSKNSECRMPDNGDGYRCFCVEGYHGNPYLEDDGCKDINECEEGKHKCKDRSHCENTEGSFKCICPDGYDGDGEKDGKGCSRGESLVFKIATGVALGVIVLLLSSCWLTLELKRRRYVKTRQQFFLQNGGILLQEKLVARQSQSSDTARIYSSSELQKATNNFHNSMIIGQGGHGTVYKGIFPGENKVVAIKKSKKVDPSEIDQFINEVIVLSQINHRNIVKLLGCCLETEAPLLVYEFISNGTLSEHVHNKEIAIFLSWDMRLRIATETAGVLSYLHSAASTPIIHRDVKTANILLDHTYTSKVADFGASRLVPPDDSLLNTLVQGTFGYLDPEYLQSRQLTEKSDVYSFGVVLMELITGRKALVKDGPEEDICLANFFLRVMKEEQLFQVVEKDLMKERDKNVVMKVAFLARRCVNIKGEERPTMKEVTMELEGLQVRGKHSWVHTEGVAEDAESLLSKGFSSSFVDLDDNKTSSSGGFDSLKDQILLPVRGGR